MSEDIDFPPLSYAAVAPIPLHGVIVPAGKPEPLPPFPDAAVAAGIGTCPRCKLSMEIPPIEYGCDCQLVVTWVQFCLGAPSDGGPPVVTETRQPLVRYFREELPYREDSCDSDEYKQAWARTNILKEHLFCLVCHRRNDLPAPERRGGGLRPLPEEEAREEFAIRNGGCRCGVDQRIYDYEDQCLRCTLPLREEILQRLPKCISMEVKQHSTEDALCQCRRPLVAVKHVVLNQPHS